MRWNIRSIVFALGAVLLALSNKRPDSSEDDRQRRQNTDATSNYGKQPISDMLRAEWATFQSSIREIHRSEERHQAAERDAWARQIRAAHGLNWITAIGAIVGIFGLVFVGFNLVIAKQAADDAHSALVAANRAWVGPKNCCGCLPDR